MTSFEEYPSLSLYAQDMSENHKYDSIGTEDKQKEILSILNQERMKNVLLRGFAGVGKTQVVETLANKVENSNYKFISIDLDTMGANGNNEFGSNIKALLKEIIEFQNKTEKEIVLFIDEIHKIGLEGFTAGLDSFKTAIARGQVRLIGATTFEEIGHIESNAAMIDRMEYVTIDEPPKEVVEIILEDFWVKAFGDDEPVNKKIIKKIVEYGRYSPSKANPRKSIKLLDNMIGRYRTESVTINEALLDKIVYDSTGINTKIRPDINEIEAELKRRIKGQPLAIDVLIDSLNVALAGLTPKHTPMGSYIFMGPTGVGKTETSIVMAEQLYDTADSLIRFDMSEYQGTDASIRFQHDVTDRVGKKPYSLLLFDEGEKASREVLDLFLQITSAGRLENKFKRQVTFENTYIIITTNIGFKVFEESRKLGEKIGNGKYEVAESKDILISEDGMNGFRPELVNRMTGIINFTPLESETKKEIVEVELEKFKKYLKEERRLILEYSERTVTFLYKEGVKNTTSSGGGRDIINRIRNYLYVAIAKVINKYQFDSDYDLIKVKVEPLGKLVKEKNDEKISDAILAVIEYEVIMPDYNIKVYKGFNHHDPHQSYSALDEQADISYRKLHSKRTEVGI